MHINSSGVSGLIGLNTRKNSHTHSALLEAKALSLMVCSEACLHNTNIRDTRVTAGLAVYQNITVLDV